jgi:hypothetical protein
MGTTKAHAMYGYYKSTRDVWVLQKHTRCMGTTKAQAMYEDLIYLLTAIGLSPGGSTHLYTNTI